MDNTAEYLEDLHHRVAEALRSHKLLTSIKDIERSKPKDDRVDDDELLRNCADSIIVRLQDHVRRSLQRTDSVLLAGEKGERIRIGTSDKVWRHPRSLLNYYYYDALTDVGSTLQWAQITRPFADAACVLWYGGFDRLADSDVSVIPPLADTRVSERLDMDLGDRYTFDVQRQALEIKVRNALRKHMERRARSLEDFADNLDPDDERRNEILTDVERMMKEARFRRNP